MAELSIADFTGNPNATAGGAVAAPKPKAPRTMSVEEFAGPSANKKTENLESNVAQGLDLIAGLPAFAMQVGETGMVDIIAALSGDESPLKAGREAVQQQWSGEAGQALSKPVQTMAGTKPEGTAMGDVNTVISQGIDDAAEHYQNKYGGQAGETVRQLANIATLRGVEDMAKVGRAAIQAVKPTKATPKPAPEAEAAPETPPPKPTHGTFFGVEDDAQINATKIAHDLLNRNASHKEVQAAIKRNPLVGTVIDRTMKRREEVREGPMKETLQGEVLGPEEARAATAAAHPEPQGYKQAIEGMAQKRIEAAQTPDKLPAPGPAVFRAGREEKPAEQPGGPEPTVKEAEQDFTKGFQDIVEGVEERPPEDFAKAQEANREAMRRSLGGKEQGGFIDPELLGRIAAVGIGAAAGAYVANDSKVEGAILGAFGAALLTKMSPAGAVDFLKKMKEPDQRIRVNNLGDRREYTIEAARVTHARLAEQVKKLVPDKKRQEAISHWREGDKSIKLNADEMAAAKLAEDFFSKMKEAGFEAGVLKSAREDYVTHMWEWGLQGKSKVEAAMAKKGVGEGMSPKSRFAKERTIETLKEGKELGLTPKTEAIGEIMEAYGNSMAQSIANAEFIKGLKAAKDLEGKSILLPADKAPHTYVSINHPQLAGMRVHPDIAASMEFMFDSHSPSVGSRALEAFNTALKRTAVSFSLFHNKALFDARMGAASNPFKAIGQLGKIVAGKDLYLKELREQGLGPNIDLALKGGLKFSMERKGPASEDVGGSFYGALEDIQGMLDKTIPGMGAPVKGLIEVNHAVDTLTWARMHTGLKLNTFMEKYETILANNAKAHERAPDKVKLMNKEEAAKIAASFTNDIFGGLNWRRLAEGSKTRFGRDLALWAFKPSNRRIAQLAFFAPDWTISTVRALTQAFQQGSGIKGLMSPSTLADLHRQYILRSAAYYMITGNILNMAFSGHPIWDNKDKTRIDMGDGRTMQWSKHTMEPVHWLTQPKQQLLNKLGVIPRQVGEQLQGVEYLSASGKAPPMQEGAMKHLLHGISPISVQQNFDAGTSAGVAGFLGAPIYGKTPEQKQVESIEKRIRKLEEEAQ